MKVIVDTSAWSLVLRRSSPDAKVAAEIDKLVRQGRVQLLGVIRQELLSGVRTLERFEALRAELEQFDDLPVETQDHEEAARICNKCRGKGVQGNVVDMLICALAVRHEMSIYTFDEDFTSYARHAPLELHRTSTSP